MSTHLALEVLDQLTGSIFGTIDIACPLCGPNRHNPQNRKRKVMRVWRHGSFASFHCVRCGASGFASEKGATSQPEPIALARARAAVADQERRRAADQHRKALSLWRRRRPIAGTVAESYLREVRTYGGPLPATLGFLPPRGGHPPAIVAAFGFVGEPEPGVIAIADHTLRGVHITKLLPDGSGKANTQPNKMMLGSSMGSPIVLAPVNDMFGLAVGEGIEDALSAHEATGLGVWAAGCASRLPALADVIPGYVESLSVLVDGDDAGRRHASELARRAAMRGMEVRLVTFGGALRSAA